MLQPLNVTILFAVSKMTPPVPVDPAGHTHRVLLTSNQKLEVVGDEDFRFVQERDSEMVKTARVVQHHGGSISAAQAAAPEALGLLARSCHRASKLPAPPAEATNAELGAWAAKIIAVRVQPFVAVSCVLNLAVLSYEQQLEN